MARNGSADCAAKQGFLGPAPTFWPIDRCSFPLKVRWRSPISAAVLSPLTAPTKFYDATAQHGISAAQAEAIVPKMATATNFLGCRLPRVISHRRAATCNLAVTLNSYAPFKS